MLGDLPGHDHVGDGGRELVEVGRARHLEDARQLRDLRVGEAAEEDAALGQELAGLLDAAELELGEQFLRTFTSGTVGKYEGIDVRELEFL